jgi:outer membrane protein assembly factor BamB
MTTWKAPFLGGKGGATWFADTDPKFSAKRSCLQTDHAAGRLRADMIRRFFLLISAVSLSSVCLAEDWPEFRGPTGQGHSTATELPVEWGPQKNVVWKAAVPGLAWSSPVVVAGQIYLTTAVEKGADHELCALALDAETGSILWQQTLFLQKEKDAPKIHKKNSHASPTPIFEDGKLYAHFGHMGTACLEATTGKVLWSTQAFGYAPVHGNGGSPVLVDDLLIFAADAASEPSVIAVEKKSGKLRWRTPRVAEATRKFSFCTPLVIEVDGKKQLITPGSGVVQALDPQSGQEIWRVNYEQGYSVVPRPVFAHGMLYICTGYDKPRLLAIRVDAAAKGNLTESHVAWRVDKYIPHNPSVLVVGDEFYCVADNGILSCLDAKTGEPYYQERCTGPSSSSPLYADGKIFLLDERGQAVVVQPGKTMKVLATNEMEERCLASYSVVGSDLLLRTADHLYRIGKR